MPASTAFPFKGSDNNSYTGQTLPTDGNGNVPTSVIGRTALSTATPAITASSAYAAGNEVGALLSFASAVDTAGSGILQSIRLSSKSVQTTGFKLYLFTSNPNNTTWTDKTAPAITAADIPALVDVFSLLSADSGLGTHTLYALDNIGKSFAIASGSTLYGILTTTGTPTFASTSDIAVSLNIIKD